MESGHVLRKGDSHVPDTSATRALAHAPRTSKRPFHLNSERAAHPDRCAAYFVSSHLGRERPTNMIPEDTLNFNHNGPPSNFDDHEARLRHLLRQDAMPTSDGGRHLLLVCPICKHPWYKAGRHEPPSFIFLDRHEFHGQRQTGFDIHEHEHFPPIHVILLRDWLFLPFDFHLPRLFDFAAPLIARWGGQFAAIQGGYALA